MNPSYSDKWVTCPSCQKKRQIHCHKGGNLNRKCSSCSKKGRVLSKETKAKISATSLKRIPTFETRAKMSAAKKGKKLTPEHKANISTALKGRVCKPETKEKISISNMNHRLSHETRAKISISLTGRKLTPEHAEKIGAASKGRVHTAETRAKISAALKGKGKGWEHTPEAIERIRTALINHKVSDKTKEKISIANSGENNGCWLGGISFEPYTPEFNRALKSSIRRRDNYTCQLCKIPQAECIRKLYIHHINYVKEDCNPNNLISLCHSCNSKVNSNREYWIGYFISKLKSKEEVLV